MYIAYMTFLKFYCKWFMTGCSFSVWVPIWNLISKRETINFFRWKLYVLHKKATVLHSDSMIFPKYCNGKQLRARTSSNIKFHQSYVFDPETPWIRVIALSSGKYCSLLHALVLGNQCDHLRRVCINIWKIITLIFKVNISLWHSNFYGHSNKPICRNPSII